MAFFIAIALVIATFIYFKKREDSVIGFWSAFMAALISGFVVCILAFTITPHSEITAENTYKLKAVDTSSSIEGQSYFLSGGYINQQRTLNFIYETEDDGEKYAQVADALAINSRIYEDSTNPTVTIYTWTYSNKWIVPWGNWSHNNSYSFHVPAGSVIDNTEITNK